MQLEMLHVSTEQHCWERENDVKKRKCKSKAVGISYVWFFFFFCLGFGSFFFPFLNICFALN